MSPSAFDGRSVRALKVSLEMISNFLYLSRHTETHCAQQHAFLDQAANIMLTLHSIHSWRMTKTRMSGTVRRWKDSRYV
jgi:hypothetical protein